MWCMSGGAEHTIMLPNTCLMLPYLCLCVYLMFKISKPGSTCLGSSNNRNANGNTQESL